jgi:hypothetical protein
VSVASEPLGVLRTAACCCGQLRITCQGEPDKVSACHCLACQRRTGSAFGIAAFFPRDRVRVEGAATTYRRIADSGHGLTFHFCPHCGTTLYWEPERKPGAVAVAVGAFADIGFPPPTQAVWAEHKHAWVRLCTGP